MDGGRTDGRKTRRLYRTMLKQVRQKQKTILLIFKTDYMLLYRKSFKFCVIMILEYNQFFSKSKPFVCLHHFQATLKFLFLFSRAVLEKLVSSFFY